MQNQGRFSNVQIALHWAVFLLLIVTYATVELRGLAPRGTLTRQLVMATHFSCGVTVLALMVARIYFRIKYASPPIVPPAPKWQTFLATLTHILIYALFVALPVLAVSSRYLRGQDWALFGIGMPVAATSNPDLAVSMIQLHETLAPLGYCLIGLHAAAALFHYYFMRDNTMLRMMPSKKDRTSA